MINSNCEKCMWYCKCNELNDSCSEFTPIGDYDEPIEEDSSECEEYREAWHVYVKEFD